MKAEKKALENRSSKEQILPKGRRKSRYVLSDLMVCAECGHYYRRVPWMNRYGEKRYVWRCINRLEHGTEFCKKSPTIDERTLQREIMKMLWRLSSDCKEEEKILKVNFLDNTAIFYEDYDDNELENIVNELNDRYEYYQKMLLKDVSDREDVKRRIRIIEGEIRNITEARRQIAVYQDIKGNTEITTGRSENKQKFRDFDEVLVRRLVKKIEVVNREKCNAVLNSGQIINISMEMDT